MRTIPNVSAQPGAPQLSDDESAAFGHALGAVQAAFVAVQRDAGDDRLRALETALVEANAVVQQVRADRTAGAA